MSNFGMVGKLSSDPENRDKIVDILVRGAEQMKTLDGCHMYIVSKDLNNETDVWVMELWESKEAHDHSLTLPWVRELINEAMPMIKGSPDGASLTPVGGKGLDQLKSS